MPRECSVRFTTAFTLLLASGLLLTRPSLARPGTHAPAISTWDTRASSVVLQGQSGFVDGGHFHTVGYNANFTSTSGNLSAQFGLHYLNLQVPNVATQHGFAASAVGLLSVPLTDRFDNGVPTVALGMYLGAVPSALISGRWNDLTFPLTLGAGLPLSPASSVTFTPWFEFAPSVNLDTVINPYFFETPLGDITDLESLEDFINRNPDGTIAGIQGISVRKILEQAVEYRVRTVSSARTGLTIGLHASEVMDLNLGVTLGSFGRVFEGPTFVQVGGGLVVRWDSIVPAVLPADRRLMNEDCGAVARRHFACEMKARKDAKKRAPRRAPGAWSPALPAPSTASPPAAAPVQAPLVQPPPVQPPPTQPPPAATAPTAPPSVAPPPSQPPAPPPPPPSVPSHPTVPSSPGAPSGAAPPAAPGPTQPPPPPASVP